MRGMPILGPELTFKKDSVTQVQRKQTAHTGEVPSFLNFVDITHRFPAISSQAHVEYQAESQQEWKRQDRNKRC